MCGFLIGKIPWCLSGTNTKDSYGTGKIIGGATPTLISEQIQNISIQRCWTVANTIIDGKSIPETCYVNSNIPIEQSKFIGWDFENTWYMDLVTKKPKLQWEKLIK